jgi:uncharacterized membrane protein
MTNPQAASAPPTTTSPAAVVNTRGALIIYILYLVTLMSGVTSVIGLVMAYVYRGDGSSWIDSHYQLQIRTFWIGLLYAGIAFVATAVMIGWLILLFLAVWYVVRIVKGMRYLRSGRPYPNPTTWLW